MVRNSSRPSRKMPHCRTRYKFVRMIFQCTGVGIFVPIFVNAVPVPLAQDAYSVAIMVAFLLHEYFPVLREILNKSAVFKMAMTILYETQRTSVVVKLTTAAAAAIAPSEISFPVFGPIFCGSIAGCGGAFLPLDKGLNPIKEGLGQPMLLAFLAASCFHLFMSTSMSDGIVEAKAQGQIAMAFFFIAYAFYSNILSMLVPAPQDLTKGLSADKPIAIEVDDEDDTSPESSEDEGTKITNWRSKLIKKKKVQ